MGSSSKRGRQCSSTLFRKLTYFRPSARALKFLLAWIPYNIQGMHKVQDQLDPCKEPSLGLPGRRMHLGWSTSQEDELKIRNDAHFNKRETMRCMKQLANRIADAA
eukprot:7902291-Pyramimonas_sp.AAC.1